MKKWTLFFVIAAAVYACGADSGDSQSSAKAETAEAPAVDGEKIYKQYCITCHGLYGDMGASGAFNLQESKLKAEERVQVITNGRPGTAMAPFKSLLTEDKIKAVAKYTMKLSKQK